MTHKNIVWATVVAVGVSICGCKTFGQGCGVVMTQHYSAYSTHSTDGTHIFTTVVTDGSGTCNPTPSCPCNTATHTPKSYNKLGSVGGWGTGNSSCAGCYISYSNSQSIVAAPGVVYLFQGEGEVICSIAGTFFFSQLPNQNLQLPSVTGPSTVWWFNGENPDPTQYPISITLTSSAGASTTWAVQQSDQKVTLSATSGSTTKVTSTGNYFSGSAGDISVTATDSTSNLTSKPFTITSRRPWKLVYLPAQSSTSCYTGYGYLSDLEYDLVDQLSGTITNDIFWNETVTTPQSQNGSNWGIYGLSTSGGSTGPLIDQLSGPGVNNTPPPNPLPKCNNPPQGTTPYRVATQNIQVANGTKGGVFVQQDTLTYYIDQGAHTAIIVPPKPPL